MINKTKKHNINEVTEDLEINRLTAIKKYLPITREVQQVEMENGRPLSNIRFGEFSNTRNDQLKQPKKPLPILALVSTLVHVFLLSV